MKCADLKFPEKTKVNPSHGLEWLKLGLILICFLVINLWTAGRSPTVWSDEVFVADPAANALEGRGFITSASVLGPNDLWAGNAPLHTWLLYLWFKCWGFGVLSVRSINYVYTAAALLLVWLTLRRSQLVKDDLRLLLIIILACQYDVTFCYRCGRYDCLGLLLIVAIAAAHTLAEGRRRAVLLLSLGFLLPFCGLQLLPFAVTAYGVAFFLGAGWCLLPAALGVMAGGLFMIALWKSLGVWGNFQIMIAANSGLNPDPLWQRLLFAPAPFLRGDPSLSLAVVALVVALIFCYREHIRWTRSKSIVALILMAFLVPLVMAGVGHFPIYYYWMADVPLVVAIFCLLALLPPSRRLARGCILFLLVCSAGLGFPARVGVVLSEWSQRDYRPVEEFVRAHVASGEKVGAAYSTFYAMREFGIDAVYEAHISSMTPSEKMAVDAMIIDPRTCFDFEATLGGSWVKEASFRQENPYRTGEADLYTLDYYQRQIADKSKMP